MTDHYRGKVKIEFTPIEECPIVGKYIIRTMSKFEIRDEEGRLLDDTLKDSCKTNN